MTFFSEEFINWLDDHADQIDKESCAAGNQLIERIAAEGAFRVGVPEELGGRGGNDTDVIEVLKELAHHSLTASFISWGQRTFIDNVLKSANPYFRDHYLEGLLSGEYAGATALSNAVKFLSDLEELNVFYSGRRRAALSKGASALGNQCSRGSLPQHICCRFRRREPPATCSGCAI